MNDSEEPELLRAKLNLETARIPWRELQGLFASGNTVSIDPSLDLVEVAYRFARDDREQVAVWIESGRVHPVTDAQALAWHDAEVKVWAVVVRPFVLVQPPPAGPAGDALE